MIIGAILSIPAALMLILVQLLPLGPWTISATFATLWNSLVSLASPLGLFVVPDVAVALIVANAVMIPILAVAHAAKYLIGVIRGN